MIMGCTHSLHLTNQQEIKPSQVKLAKDVKIGFVSSDDVLTNSVIEQMNQHEMVKARKNYEIGSEVAVDYVAELVNTITYSSSGQNFPVTFPGFLIFTHAWLGYKYYANIDTQSKILDRKGKVLSEQKITTPYEFRYTGMGRGATTSLIGWFTPGLGGINIITGIVFAISYDSSGNTDFLDKATPSFKSSISSKVLEQIATVQNIAMPTQKMSNKMEEAVVDAKSTAPKEVVIAPKVEQSVAQRLSSLEKLRDEGLITDDEYEQKRKTIVDGI